MAIHKWHILLFLRYCIRKHPCIKFHYLFQIILKVFCMSFCPLQSFPKVRITTISGKCSIIMDLILIVSALALRLISCIFICHSSSLQSAILSLVLTFIACPYVIPHPPNPDTDHTCCRTCQNRKQSVRMSHNNGCLSFYHQHTHRY